MWTYCNKIDTRTHYFKSLPTTGKRQSRRPIPKYRVMDLLRSRQKCQFSILLLKPARESTLQLQAITFIFYYCDISVCNLYRNFPRMCNTIGATLQQEFQAYSLYTNLYSFASNQIYFGCVSFALFFCITFLTAFSTSGMFLLVYTCLSI